MPILSFEEARKKRDAKAEEPELPAIHPNVVNYHSLRDLHDLAVHVAVTANNMGLVDDLLAVLRVALEHRERYVILDDGLFRRLMPHLAAFAEGRGTREIYWAMYNL